MHWSRRRLVGLCVVVAFGVAGVLGARAAIDALSPPECVFAAADHEVSLTPEQAANASTIAAVGVQRGLPPRAATIALATAIQESKLRNLRYGHADSQGLFQQRPSQGWGSVEQVTDPVFASNSFYSALERVSGWQDGVITEVAQEVQRSAFPDAYAVHERDARVLATVLTGQEGTATRMGCDLGTAQGRGSGQGTATKLQDQLGVEARVESGTRLTLDSGQEAVAWAVGTWAVSHAEAEEVISVQVGNQRWDRNRSPLQWQPASGDGTGPDDSATTVTIELN